jgi:hypothetical protein
MQNTPPIDLDIQNTITASPARSSRPGSGNPEEEPWRRPSIRIRRLASSQSLNTRRDSQNISARPRAANNEYRDVSVDAGPLALQTLGTTSTPGSFPPLRHENQSVSADGQQQTTRSRASSDPPHMQWPSIHVGGIPRAVQRAPCMPTLEESAATSTLPTRPPNSLPPGELGDGSPENAASRGIGRRLSNAAGQTYSRFFPTLESIKTAPAGPAEEQYDSEAIVDVLDTVGTFISTCPLKAITDSLQTLKFPPSAP